MYGYIYETINLINRKKYIGQHKANKFDKNYYGSGKILKQVLLREGKENFEVRLIEKCNNQEELNNKEIYWIKYYNAIENNNYYNIGAGGSSWNNSFNCRPKEEITIEDYLFDQNIKFLSECFPNYSREQIVKKICDYNFDIDSVILNILKVSLSA